MDYVRAYERYFLRKAPVVPEDISRPTSFRPRRRVAAEPVSSPEQASPEQASPEVSESVPPADVSPVVSGAETSPRARRASSGTPTRGRRDRQEAVVSEPAVPDSPAEETVAPPEPRRETGSWPGSSSPRSRRGVEDDRDPWEGLDQMQPPPDSRRNPSLSFREPPPLSRQERRELRSDRAPAAIEGTEQLAEADRRLSAATQGAGGSTRRSLGIVRDSVFAAQRALAKYARLIEPEMLALVRRRTHPRVWMLGGEQEPHISQLIREAREMMPSQEEVSDPHVRTMIGHEIMEKLHEDKQVEALMDRFYRPLAYTEAHGIKLLGEDGSGRDGLLAAHDSDGASMARAIGSGSTGFRHLLPQGMSKRDGDQMEDMLEASARLFVKRANARSRRSADSDELVNIGGNISREVREMLARRQAAISGRTTRVR